MDLGKHIKMIIFKSLLTTFAASSIFKAAEALDQTTITKLSLSKSLICTVGVVNAHVLLVRNLNWHDVKTMPLSHNNSRFSSCLA